jgi:hypothetical protein
MDLRFGTLNVSSPYESGSLKTVAKELAKCGLELMDVEEVRWDMLVSVEQQKIILLWKTE